MQAVVAHAAVTAAARREEAAVCACGRAYVCVCVCVCVCVTARDSCRPDFASNFSLYPLLLLTIR